MGDDAEVGNGIEIKLLYHHIVVVVIVVLVEN